MRIKAKYNINEILYKLAQLGVFTVKEATNATGLKEIEVKIILPWLKRSGFLERIEKGKYFVNYRILGITLSEYVIATLIVEPSAIAYWTALSFHDLTEQTPQMIFVQTTARKKKQELELFGVKYKIVRVKQTKFFGFQYSWLDTGFGRFKVTVTDKEKTIIDCLDMPKYCGGISEVVKALKSEEYDIDKLSAYAKEFGKTTVIRRLGYLCESLGVEIDLPKINTRNYVLLDPTLPKQGKVVAKWRIIDNVGVSDYDT